MGGALLRWENGLLVHRWHSYEKAKDRCQNPNSNKYSTYGARGIKFLLTKKDMAKLWGRDKARLLKRPSINRIDDDKNYEYSNCEFVELVANCRAGGFKRWGKDTTGSLKENQN